MILPLHIGMTCPTTTLITLNNSAEVQRVNRDYVLYAWADVPITKKFGSYKCNGDGSGGGAEDGPYVELGFRPALTLKVLIIHLTGHGLMKKDVK